MNAIDSEIKKVQDEVIEERKFLTTVSGKGDFLSDMEFNDSGTTESFTSNYISAKTKELTIDDFWFENTWSILTYDQRKTVIGKLEAQNQQQLADWLKEKIVLFEDLTEESDSVFKEIIRNTDWQVLAKSVKISGDWSDDDVREILDRLTGCMTRRQASMFREDIDFMGPVRRSEVLEARQEICLKLRKIHNL